MYPVTKAVAEQFKTNAKQNLSLLVNPVVGESFELTSADILSAGLNINRYSATGDSVALGVCSAADLSLRVENGDGRFNDVVFEGAQIYASVGVEDGNNTQWVPLGYFTVDNAPRRLAVISITALDGMVQFDKLANRSALSLPNSVKNIVLACCNECNITIDTDLDALPNSSFVAQSVGDSEDLTYRTILQWCCQVMGVNGYMDWDGHLELSWYKKDGIPETVSGSIATFESVTNVPVSQLIVNIEPYQNLNGYDHPWAGGAEKNKLPTPVKGTYSSGGLTLTVDDKGVITVSGTTTSSGTVLVPLSQSYVIPSSVMQGGTGCMYLFNSFTTGTQNAFVMYYDDTRVETWQFTVANRKSDNWVGQAGKTINKIGVQFTSGQTYNGNFAPMFSEDGTTDATSFVPYSNICPIYPANGKNLLPRATGRTVYGVTFTVNDDNSITLNGTPTAVGCDCYFVGDASGDYRLPNIPTGQYLLSGGIAHTVLYVVKEGGTIVAETNGSVTVDIDSSIKYRIFLRAIQGYTHSNTKVYPMLRPVETADQTYVPYNAIGITRTGKNLFSVPYENGTISTQGVPITDTTYYRVCFVKVEQGTYTLSWTGTSSGANFRYFLYDKDGNFLRMDGVVGTDVRQTITITDASYISFRWLITTNLTNLQFEEGSFTSYEPYTGERYYSTSDNPIYGGTLDVVSGVLTVTHKCKNFDNYTGTITKSGSTTIPEGRIVWYIPAFSDSPNSGGDANQNHVTMKCSIYDIQDKSYQYNVLPATSFAMGIGRASGHAMVGVNLDASYSTTALVRAWLQSAHVDIWYPLETPVTYQLTPAQVELLKGTNNIWTDGDSTISVTFPAVTEITPADRYNSDIYENAVTITGVSVKGKENQSVVGSEDYALAIDGNPLFTDDDVETIANGLSGLVGFSYHPFSASVLPMPYLYPLDMVAVQYKDEWYDCAITEINFTSTAPTQLKGTGESAQSRSYARINPLTNRERAIIENLKDEMNTTLNKAVNNIIDFNNIISNALGLYHTNVADGSGGFIRYLHDAPDLESSTYIVTETAQGFAWTTNGWNGGTPVWQYGVTSGGYALFKWLSAEGIDVTRASSDYRAEVTPEHFNIYYKSDLIITIDATDRAIQTPRMVIPYSSTSNNSLRVGQLVWLPTPNGANAVVLGS